MGLKASNNSPEQRPSRKGATRGKGGGNGLPLRFEIPSDFAAGRKVQKRILDNVARSGFDSHSAFAIRLALEEALVNAIKHGNKLDPKKKVHIEAKVTPKRAEIVVEDEGPGFCRTTVPDPTSDENVCKITGRGILLIEAFMNRVRWSHGGRRVRMVKQNESKLEKR